MHPDHKYLFVVTPIKDSDVSPVRQTFHAPPEIIVVEIFRRRRLERIDLAALRIQTGHHMLDGAILARGIHSLKDEKHRPPILGIKFCPANLPALPLPTRALPLPQ